MAFVEERSTYLDIRQLYLWRTEIDKFVKIRRAKWDLLLRYKSDTIRWNQETRIEFRAKMEMFGQILVTLIIVMMYESLYLRHCRRHTATFCFGLICFLSPWLVLAVQVVNLALRLKGVTDVAGIERLCLWRVAFHNTWSIVSDTCIGGAAGREGFFTWAFVFLATEFVVSTRKRCSLTGYNGRKI